MTRGCSKLPLHGPRRDDEDECGVDGMRGIDDCVLLLASVEMILANAAQSCLI